MKTTIIHVLLICMAATGPLMSAAQQQQQQQQQQENFPHRYLSLGIRPPGIQSSDLASRAYPTSRLVLALDPVKYFRLEGQFGVYNTTSSREDSQAGGSTTLELHSKSTFAGFGIMGMVPVDHGRFIAGIRYSVNKYSDDEVFDYPSYAVDENTGKMTFFSGMIGGEYFIARFFSIGAEFSVSSVKDVYEPSSLASNPSPETDKTILTEGNLVFRFYPF